ncbi:hypothetical protein [Granulicella sp. L60]|uniref:hypothetical protein n=1 Tax=Granulicella sp. L60 TaxID=1641866 RepID=UPI00131B8284|nr:hypothetical protein [Granulicella sp. L60]
MLARCVMVTGLGVAAILMQGCKQKVAPVSVQPVVRTVPRAPLPPDFDAPLPAEDPDTSQSAAVHRQRRAAPQPVQLPAPVVRFDAEAADAVQRRQDARLLQQQEAASQAQQKELNQVVDRSVKAQQQMEAEPRIQDAPTGGFAPVPEGPRIQDAPGPAQTLPHQPGQEEEDEPRIQDAPGPAQTQPTPPPSQPAPPQI